MRVFKIRTGEGVYYTVSGEKSNTNYHGEKGDFTKELWANVNGRKFLPHFVRTAETRGEIQFSELPKGLQKSFEDYKEWLNTPNI